MTTAFLKLISVYVCLKVLYFSPLFGQLTIEREKSQKEAARHFAENHFAEMTLCLNDTLPIFFSGATLGQTFFNSENLARPSKKQSNKIHVF